MDFPAKKSTTIHAAPRLLPAGIIVALLGGCASHFDEYRFITQPEKYELDTVKTDFDLPDLQDIDLGISGGIEHYWNESEATGFKYGIDLKVSLDSVFGKRRNRSSNPSDYNDCVKKSGRISYLDREDLTPIPFIGLDKSIGDGEFFIEFGLPYATWNLESGRAGRSVSCYARDHRVKDSVLGSSIRLGLKKFDNLPMNLFLSHEYYDTSFARVEVWGLGWTLDF